MQNADVAQLVEQRFRKPQVVGSIPIVGSILKKQNLEYVMPVGFHAFSIKIKCGDLPIYLPTSREF